MLELFIRTQTSLRARAERGAGMAEYVLLIALVAAAMVAAFGGLVTAMQTQLTNIGTSISGAN